MSTGMKKVLIIGPCGSGKSTLAKQLSEKLSLPLINLDRCYWKPGWTKTPTDQWRALVTELVKKDGWIMDGNYQSTFDIRFPVSDTIIWLKVNRFLCLLRALKRRVFKDRVDPLDDCHEKIDFEFVKWILWDHPTEGKNKILEFIKKHPDKKIFILKNKKDVKNLLSSKI